MKNAAKFWDRWAKRYAKSKMANPELYQRKIDKTIEALPADAVILEMGCGTGSTALKLAPHVSHVDASDFSGEMINIARGKAKDGGVNNVQFEQQGVTDYLNGSPKYDAVLAHSVMHLMEDYSQAITAAHTTLKPNGLFISTTACLGDTAFWLKAIAPIGHLVGLLPYVAMIKQDDFLRSIEAQGFDIEYTLRENGADALFVMARKRA